jgi:alkanesulfonate monooxygenase SsuD/methylene tetrahydromethanopterin reductase-like flavin-dependent oxidoreductase (luciferase family)
VTGGETRAAVLRGDVGALVAGARALEARGGALAVLEEAPLLAAAALAPHTCTLRIVAALAPDAGEHPLALAEAAVVADLLLGGRLILLIERGETAEALALALSGRPFRFAGERWTIGATQAVAVTPPVTSIPIWHEFPAGITLEHE